MKYVLFDSASANLDSPTFEAKGQVTIIATGLQPGDYITFEAVRVKAGAAGVCGCRLTGAVMASIEGIVELVCPVCETGVQRPVRLTERNPVVILDVPQNSLLRAIYHGDGIDLRTVNVWAEDSNTPDLTDALRGCPPVCCEDDPQTWEETGVTRCIDSTTTVEVQEISNCGNYRWVEAAEQPADYWSDTGVARCGTGATTQLQQTNPCGGIRWVAGPAQTWMANGLTRCTATNVENQEVNQCGDIRWVDSGQSVSWQETGVTRCSGSQVQLQESNQCGDVRWANTGVPVAWTDTGTLICSTTNDTTTQAEQTNQCGERRLVAGPAQIWTATGTTRCTSTVVQSQEVNQCGRTRWVGAGTPVVWVGTGVRRCGSTVVEDQEVNQCGELRWVPTTESVFWMPTGLQICINDVLQVQESNNCGNTRWQASGECPEEPYKQTYIIVDPTSGEGGTTFCWTIGIDRPVEGQPLVIATFLSGQEQASEEYPAPNVTIPVGSTTGQACIATTSDGPDPRDLCMTLQGSTRFTPLAGVSCVQVLPPAETTYALTGFAHNAGASPAAGQSICYTATIDRPVEDSVLQIVVSGGKLINIPVGQTTGQFCDTTTCQAYSYTVTPGGTGNDRLTGAAQTASTTVASYTLTSVTRTPASVQAGQAVTFTGTLNRAVVGAARTVTIRPLGSTGGNITLSFAPGQTTASAPFTYPTAGSFTPTYISRSDCVTGTPALPAVTVTPVPTAKIIDITSSVTGDLLPGQQVCYTVTADMAAPTGGLPFTVTVSGNAGYGGNVCGSYNGSGTPVLTTLPGTIPAGQTSAQVCYTLPGA